jgi:hypothetical protein
MKEKQLEEEKALKEQEMKKQIYEERQRLEREAIEVRSSTFLRQGKRKKGFGEKKNERSQY